MRWGGFLSTKLLQSTAERTLIKLQQISQRLTKYWARTGWSSDSPVYWCNVLLRDEVLGRDMTYGRQPLL